MNEARDSQTLQLVFLVMQSHWWVYKYMNSQQICFFMAQRSIVGRCMWFYRRRKGAARFDYNSIGNSFVLRAAKMVLLASQEHFRQDRLWITDLSDTAGAEFWPAHLGQGKIEELLEVGWNEGELNARPMELCDMQSCFSASIPDSWWWNAGCCAAYPFWINLPKSGSHHSFWPAPDHAIITIIASCAGSGSSQKLWWLSAFWSLRLFLVGRHSREWKPGSSWCIELKLPNAVDLVI